MKGIFKHHDDATGPSKPASHMVTSTDKKGGLDKIQISAEQIITLEGR